MDTLGAVVGPAIALALIGVLSYSHIFLISFIPGAITVFVVVFLLKDIVHPPNPSLRLLSSLRSLPKSFWKYTGAVGVFGLGNFATTLLILRAVVLLTPRFGVAHAGKIAIGLYILNKVLYAAISYPIGALGDRVNKRSMLMLGYGLFALICVGFIFVRPDLLELALLFAAAGIYIGIVDAMERSMAAELLPDLALRATGYGALATVNSFGDLISSLTVGLLWSCVSYSSGFCYSAVLTLLGALMLLAVPKSGRTKE